MIKVRTRQTLSGRGVEEIDSSVYCPRSESSVPAAKCGTCGFSPGVEDSADGLVVHCTHSSAAQPPPQPRAESAAAQTRLTDVMTRAVTCVRSDMTIETASALLDAHRISGAPVVDETGHPVGIVSRTDLLREALEYVAEAPDAPVDDGYQIEPASRGSVLDVMMPMAFTLPEKASLARAAALMAYEGIHRVPVVDDTGAVVGIISTLDVTRWLAENDGFVLKDRD